MRRTLSVAAFVCVATLGLTVRAQTPAPLRLPLDNLGLEHLDIVVPDTAASARFYARIFKAPLHQQPVRDTLRYFVVLGDVPADRQVGYIAIGAAAPGRAPAIGHYCVLAKTYNRDALTGALEAAGLPAKPTAPGPIGMWPDPDGLELQLFQPPAGLVTAAVPSPLPVEGDGFIRPLGVDHVMLDVASLDRSLPYYRGLYGTAAERPRDANGRVWFELDRGTRLGLQPVAAGGKPTISHYAIRVAPFDRAALAGRLRELGADVLPSSDEPGVVRFRDNYGIVVEVIPRGPQGSAPQGAAAARQAPGPGPSSARIAEAVNARDADGATALLRATWSDDRDAVTALLRKGADVSLANALGITPAYVAAENGNAAMLRLLLDAGAGVETADSTGDTLLMAAVRAGSSGAVQLLLDRGANVNAAEPQYGHTALMWAVRRNDASTVQRLLAKGARVDATTRVGEKPAARPPGTGGGSHGVGIVRSGIPPQGEQQPTPGGMTPLLFAARDGLADAAALLVAAGADVNAADPNGITPLLMALTNRQLPVAKLLLDHGADPRRADWWGRTPLWAAVDIRNLAVRSGTSAHENGVDRDAAMTIISMLLDRGVDVNARVKEFPPARRYLLPLGSLEWVDFTGQTAFVRAAQAADVAVMKLLLANGADPKITTFNGTNALMAAAGVNWVIGETFSESPAAWLQAVQLCLDLGFDVNAANDMGLQAVHGAANRGSDDIIDLLAQHGAQLDRPDKEGRTPYVWAQGVFLATNSPVAKPTTMALIERLVKKGEVTAQ